MRFRGLDAVLVIWNNDRALWPGCAAQGLDVTEGAWHLGAPLHPRVYFAEADRIDNHFVVPGTLTDLPSRAVVVMDDDIAPHPHISLELLHSTWRVRPHLVVGPRSAPLLCPARARRAPERPVS